MSGLPFLKLYTDAYFGGTKHLTCEQHGAYLQLLIIAWKSPGCSIPDDDAKICRMISITPKRWRAIKPTVMAFWTLEDGAWTQARLLKERDFAENKAGTSRSNGAKGGRPRDSAGKSKSEKRNPVSNSPEMPTEVPNPLKPNGLGNPEGFNLITQIEPRKKPTRRLEDYTDKKEAPPIVSNKLDTHTKPAFGGRFDEFWIAYPHKVGKDAASRKFDAIRKSGRVQFSELMAGLEAYKTNKPPTVAWCNPATWLNEGRWQDQPAKMNGAGRPQPRSMVC